MINACVYEIDLVVVFWFDFCFMEFDLIFEFVSAVYLYSYLTVIWELDLRLVSFLLLHHLLYMENKMCRRNLSNVCVFLICKVC